MPIKIKSKSKKKSIYMLTIAVMLAMVSTILFLVHFYMGLGAETYDAAIAADDAGNQKKAIELFKEACHEGSNLACKAIKDE